MGRKRQGESERRRENEEGSEKERWEEGVGEREGGDSHSFSERFIKSEFLRYHFVCKFRDLR